MATKRTASERDDAEESSSKKPRVDDEESSGSKLTPAQQRLFELRGRLNQARKLNHQEVVDEDSRKHDPDFDRKKREKEMLDKRAAERKKKQEERAAKGETVEDDEEELRNEEGKPIGRKRESTKAPISDEEKKRRKYLHDTVDAAEWRQEKWKKDPATFGWDIFNADSLFKAHDKRLKNLSVDLVAYEEQKKKLGEGMYSSIDALNYGGTMADPVDRVEALKADVQAQVDKRAKFSRRRQHYDDADITAINDRNAVFNKKISRAFDSYTLEIRQNLERGTAL